MERDISPPAKPRCHEKLGFGLVAFDRDGKSFGGLVFIPEHIKDREESVRHCCAPSHPHNPLHLTFTGAQTKAARDKAPFRQTMMARTIAILTLVQSPDPKTNELCIHPPNASLHQEQKPRLTI